MFLKSGKSVFLNFFARTSKDNFFSLCFSTHNLGSIPKIAFFGGFCKTCYALKRGVPSLWFNKTYLLLVILTFQQYFYLAMFYSCIESMLVKKNFLPTYSFPSITHARKTQLATLPGEGGQENIFVQLPANLTVQQISSLISSAELWQQFSELINSSSFEVFLQQPCLKYFRIIFSFLIYKKKYNPFRPA